MARIQFENVADRSDDELVFVREIKAVEAVDELRAVRHRDFFRMAVKNVQRHAAEHRVPQCGHLLKLVAWSRFTSGTVPWTPLIHHELHLMLPVKLAQDLPVAPNQTLHAVAFAEQFVPIDGVELYGFTFAGNPLLGFAAAQVPRVMVQSDAVNAAQFSWPFTQHFFQKLSGPLP